MRTTLSAVSRPQRKEKVATENVIGANIYKKTSLMTDTPGILYLFQTEKRPDYPALSVLIKHVLRGIFLVSADELSWKAPER